MASDKSIIGLALLAKVEAAYNTGSTTLSTSTDGIQVASLPEFDLAYAFDGSRPTPPGTAGQMRRSAPSGRTATSKITIEAKGAGATYTSSSVPPMHVFLRASGLTAALSASTWTYTPDAIGSVPASLALGVYRRGELWNMSGAYADFTLSATNGGPTSFAFDVSAVASAPSDATCPVITYPYSTVVPPKAEQIAFNLNGYANLKVTNFKFEYGRKIQPRIDLNTSTLGHGGFAPDRHSPKFTVTVESTQLTNIDPYSLQVLGTVCPVSLTVGSVANNRYTLTMSQCQVTAVKGVENGPVAQWELSLDAVQSDPSTFDDFALKFF